MAGGETERFFCFSARCCCCLPFWVERPSADSSSVIVIPQNCCCNIQFPHHHEPHICQKLLSFRFSVCKRGIWVNLLWSDIKTGLGYISGAAARRTNVCIACRLEPACTVFIKIPLIKVCCSYMLPTATDGMWTAYYIKCPRQMCPNS